MFQVASGVMLPFPERIKEEFQIFEASIILNLSFEKIKMFIDEFVAQLPEPLLFVLELPLSQQEEAEIRKDDTFPLHKKVCYLGEQSSEQMADILGRYGDLLLNDGISQFAIYSPDTNVGIYIQKYKIISIYSHTPQNYVEFLEKYGLAQTKNLLTAWDTFSDESPGQAERIQIDGMSIFDVYDELIKNGMYVAKVVED